jgi:nicotinamidase-related amidase
MATKSIADDALVLFADLQAGIVERSRTIERSALGKGVGALAQLAKIFDLPVVVTGVQTPAGPPVLIPELSEALGPVTILERSTTDSFDNDAIRKAIEASGRKSILIAGVATEVAVQRPSLRGVRDGYTVHVILDACGGISEWSESASLQRLIQAGVVLSSIPALCGELAADFSQPKAQAAVGVLMSV